MGQETKKVDFKRWVQDLSVGMLYIVTIVKNIKGFSMR